jgi:hypothetical protein
MCREGFQTGFLAGVIREACLRVQENLESVVEFLPRPRRPGALSGSLAPAGTG